MTTMPNVPMQMLTSLPLRAEHWKQIALDASWQTVRMNLNAFARHGVFNDETMVQAIRAKLIDEHEIQRSHAQPYQLMMALSQLSTDVPRSIREALHDAMEIAARQIPSLAGRVVVGVDVSGSMLSPLTGHRHGATTQVTCVHVASLIAACIYRTCNDAEIIPFSDDVIHGHICSRHDSILTNAEKLASLPSGGTNCSAVLRWMNHRRTSADLVMIVSDNQSWVDVINGPATATMLAWAEFKSRNPGALLVNIDLQPYTTVQLPEHADILNVGGFNDSVFDVIRAFVTGERNSDLWVQTIESVPL